ncbi:MAG: HAD family phosphatase [Patescibacteria group bacterium]
MIRAIIFDCFGVLVGRGFWDLYRVAGGDINKDSIFIDDILSRANSGLMSQADFHSEICEKLGITVNQWRDIVAREEPTNRELLEFIKQKLKPKYKIGILSNANNGVAERKLGDWLNIFNDVVVSAEVGMMKPDKEIFMLACRRLGCRANEAVMVDDRQEYCVAANKIGMRYIVYKDLDQFKNEIYKILDLANSN